MKRLSYLLLPLFLFGKMHAQSNCEIYRRNGDMKKYDACVKSTSAGLHYQFSREYMEIQDQALAIDPTYAHAYQAKSTAYLKSGDFITWKILIDKAVEYDPKNTLGYRGWCRYQFFRDYKGAIADIEQLEKMIDYDIGLSTNGDYHLKIAKALCYKGLGQKEKALEIIENYLSSDPEFIGLYDYLHLGVLYLELGRTEEAITAFERQTKEYSHADSEYYWAIACKSLGQLEASRQHLENAKAKYLDFKYRMDPYTAAMDKIYLSDIEDELVKLGN